MPAGIDSATKLLLHMDSDFSDSSGNGHLPTIVNGASIDTGTKKFGAGSGAFVRSSDQSVSFPDSADWDFVKDTSDFTIDFWVKHATPVGVEAYVSQFQDADNYWYIFHHNGGGGLRLQLEVAGVLQIDSTGVGEISDSLQHHIAIVKTGTTYTWFKDGVNVGSFVDASTSDITGILSVGANPASSAISLDGNVDELRITKGIARWTGNFSPRGSEYTEDPGIDVNTKLMVNANSDFSDASDTGHTPTLVNTPTIDTVIKNFGAGAGKYESASSQYVSYPSNTEFDIRTFTGSWTFDFWVYDLDASDSHVMISMGTADFQSLIIGSVTGTPIVQWSENGTTWRNVLAGTFSSNTWTHFAAVSDGGQVTLYIDGLSVGTIAMAADMRLVNGFIIKSGSHYDVLPTWFLNGNIDEFRFSRTARWVENFAPATGEYTPEGGGGGGVIILRRRTEGG